MILALGLHHCFVQFVLFVAQLGLVLQFKAELVVLCLGSHLLLDLLDHSRCITQVLLIIALGSFSSLDGLSCTFLFSHYIALERSYLGLKFLLPSVRLLLNICQGVLKQVQLRLNILRLLLLLN